MRMQTKAKIFVVTYLLGGLVVIYLSLEKLRNTFSVLPPLIWFVAFGIAQFRVLACPVCGRHSVKTVRGTYGVDPGTTCRGCGSAY
jgi:hypothetical protein